MKKIIIATALVFTTGILASQTKENSTQKLSAPVQKFDVSSTRKDIASGD